MSDNKGLAVRIIDGDGDVLAIAADGSITVGGAGGGASTIADGADVAQGTTTDAATANTVIGRLKKLVSLLPAALGSATSANSLPVVIASDQGAVSVTPGGNVAHDAVDSGNPLKVGGKAETTAPSAVSDADRVDAFFDEFGRLIVRNKSRTATVTSQADQATNVTLLALNELRLGASVVNESTSILYVKCGATASATSYTIALDPAGTVGSYYEVPFGYTGIIDGIWSADASGSARITEWT